MKNINLYLFLLIISSLSVFVSCSNDSVSGKQEIVYEAPTGVNEPELLLDFINKSGDYINTKKSPTIIKASDVNNNLSKYLVIDIRSEDNYVAGHIDGAVNVSAEELLSYMYYDANPGNYEKVVIACKSGQTAAYYSSLLHLLGYGNVYSLKWGMSSWSKSVSPNKWVSNISNKYAGSLETTTNKKSASGSFPVFSTDNNTPYDIAYARVANVADDGFKKGNIKLDKLMEEKDQYYIINYWPMDHYLRGHLPGAIQYQPKKSLSTDKFLASLPTDKPIVVYCYTGQHSAFVTAYLRVLGYDAYSLLYGANSFMNGIMRSGIGHAFDATKEINDYTLTIGENPSNKKIVKQANNQTDNSSKKVVPKKKKKKVEEEGGC